MSFDLTRGWSDRAFTPTRAMAAGLFIGGAVIVAMWTYGSVSRWLAVDPSVAPACYGAELANSGPRVESAKHLRASAEEALWRGPGDDTTRLERMTAAEQVCTARSCDRKAWEQYRSALFWYLADRLHRTRRLVDVYGERGLERARQLFGGNGDLRIERGLRERYKAGIFKIRNFRQNQDAVAILVLAGGKALRPCRRSNAPG